MGCTEPKRQTEIGRVFRRRLYDTLRTVSTAERKQRRVLIVQFQPAIDWSLAWGNIRNVILPDGARSAWYMVIHDIIPTNVRLRRIGLIDTEKCRQCGRQGTILRLTGDLGMNPHTDSSDTKDEPEPYTQEMTTSILFQTVTPTLYQTTLWFWENMVFCVMNQGMT